VLALARQPEAAGATVFFVTDRPDIIELWTEGNLSSVGYTWAGWRTSATAPPAWSAGTPGAPSKTARLRRPTGLT
jgi:hypothetical protein